MRAWRNVDPHLGNPAKKRSGKQEKLDEKLTVFCNALSLEMFILVSNANCPKCPRTVELITLRLKSDLQQEFRNKLLNPTGINLCTVSVTNLALASALVNSPS